jgi:hypothetical protein
VDSAHFAQIGSSISSSADEEPTYDGGAFGRITDRRKYLSSDLNHFSIEGHAKAAAVAWAAMRRTHVLPR